MSQVAVPPTAQASPAQSAQEWLERFASLLAGDGATVADVFVEDGWWRDIVSFGWDLRTARGPRLKELAETARAEAPEGFALRPGTDPVERDGVVQAHFDFRTAAVRGRGVVRLVDTPAGRRAWTVFTMADELVGHEEAAGPRRPKGTVHAPRRAHENWVAERERTREFADRDPAVLVVGGGHSGLALGARLGALGVPTLILERNERVGDNWRSRYPSLVLHDPVFYDHMPYLPFPPTWPVYCPKDKLGDWLEFYAAAMELNVWTSAELVSAARGEGDGAWEVVVRRGDGVTRTLRPRHIVVATGTAGNDPYRPDLPGEESFRGRAVHAKDFGGGAGYAGKRAVVVGCGNSGHDIAQDLCLHGAEVVMVQRSETCVVNVASVAASMAGLYEEGGMPVEEADVLAASMPVNASLDLMRAGAQALAAMDASTLDGLRAKGFRVGFGEDGTGLMMLFLRRGGGYYLNVGASELIAEGSIGIRPGVEPVAFSEDGLRLSDGSDLPADLVVFATGYRGMLETARGILGEAAVAGSDQVWGLDDEGEARGMWRPTGREGLWFMGGNLALARFYSKALALQLAAAEAGVHPGRTPR